MSWKREGNELVWTGREPYRHEVGRRGVVFYPGDRLSAELAAELGISASARPGAGGGQERKEDER